MLVSGGSHFDPSICLLCNQDYHRAKADFDQTKAGVKGLLDSGVLKIPKMFVHPPENLLQTPSSETRNVNFQVPVIDLKGVESGKRAKTVAEIREASECWGIFQVVNHGIPGSVLEEMIEGVQRFHEQPKEVKMKWYSREHEQKVKYYSNGDLYVSKAVNWRDSISCHYADGTLDPDALPQVCRVAITNYMEKIIDLKDKLAELLSEALGLGTGYLANINCTRTEMLVCHYYPSCPEPDLTLGATRHSDPSYLTILLQDSIGGLQVLHRNQWVDVQPVKEALIVNIGDLMQLITNDMFKSVEHRVLAAPIGPRISAACFFYPSTANSCKPYGPIKELLSERGGPIYRETNHKEYMAHYKAKGLDGTSSLPFFML
ncbi:1-aminocyclopropane-1-carboxylate oxidase homolog 1-like isoform X2 [Cynara cardunculus var. scolymus]|uniref:1-aminocyclopropane-1-carboxylate oxidase homolog 1-like isoform X2 n=1 Tax=Cynara cardunculus var. scolymus TaxID=59895 RepID=UPI000D62F6C5|nr:1-aminocyclopropane-1-carboxylate oxidase homolog 1-like isoform X2 [Cynara cardunculus var. scolymus]